MTDCQDAANVDRSIVPSHLYLLPSLPIRMWFLPPDLARFQETTLQTWAQSPRVHFGMLSAKSGLASSKNHRIIKGCCSHSERRLLAHCRGPVRARPRPALVVKRTRSGLRTISASDPKRTLSRPVKRGTPES